MIDKTKFLGQVHSKTAQDKLTQPTAGYPKALSSMRLCSYLLTVQVACTMTCRSLSCPKWLSTILIPNCMAEMFTLIICPRGTDIK